MDGLGPFLLDRVYQGDCLELMKQLPPNSVPMIWTDPPYGIEFNDGDLNAVKAKVFGKVEGSPDKKKDGGKIQNDGREDTLRVVAGMLKEASRIMAKPSCVCCCCCGGGGPDPIFAEIAQLMDVPPLSFFHAVVWDKGGLGLGLRYRRNYEFIMVAKRKGGNILWAYESGDKKTANVVRIGRIIPKQDEHPTPKPVKLIKHFLELHTKPGDLVLDPFAGSAPVGVACKAMGRRFLGFELDPHWVEIGNERIQAADTGVSLKDVKRGQASLFGGE